MTFSAGDLDRYFQALGDELSRLGVTAQIVVVGGAALVLNGVTARETGDVDVLAEMHDDVLVLPRPFTEALSVAIGRVAASYPDEIDGEWVNAAVAKDWEARWPQGLPPGLGALTWRAYGPLAVGLAGRETLIPMKVHAILDQGTRPTFDRELRVTGGTVELRGYARRHLSDLVALAPTDEELDAAKRWVSGQDTGDVELLLDAVIARVRDER